MRSTSSLGIIGLEGQSGHIAEAAESRSVMLLAGEAGAERSGSFLLFTVSGCSSIRGAGHPDGVEHGPR